MYLWMRLTAPDSASWITSALNSIDVVLEVLSNVLDAVKCAKSDGRWKFACRNVMILRLSMKACLSVDPAIIRVEVYRWNSSIVSTVLGKLVRDYDQMLW